VHQLFVDYEKAYDSVRREVLYSILAKFGIKVKVKLSLCFFFLTQHHVMKADWGVEVQLHSFFDLGSRWR
jgi:hypothetical protein